MFKKIYIGLIGFVVLIMTFVGWSFSGDTDFKDNEGKTNIYFFWSKTCPHCHNEKDFLKELTDAGKANVKDYEVNENNNSDKWFDVMDHLNVPEESRGGVPFTVIGDKYWVGYGNEKTTGAELRDRVEFCNIEENNCPDTTGALLGINTKTESTEDTSEYQTETETTEVVVETGTQGDVTKDYDIEISIFGKSFGDFDTKNASLPFAVFVIALVDGFNPCAMWILIFLITMLIDMKNRFRMFALGGTFIFISGLVYFLILSGWGKLFEWLRPYSVGVNLIIAVLALYFAYSSLKDYTEKKDQACDVVNTEKRKRVFDRIKDVIQKKSFAVSLFGISLLAFSVNIVELFCSIGLPVIYSNLLADAGITGVSAYLYHLFYAFIFMLDDLVVFTIAMVTLNITGLSAKFTRPTKLIGGIVMGLIGLYLYWQFIQGVF